jgi:hypothetical protein
MCCECDLRTVVIQLAVQTLSRHNFSQEAILAKKIYRSKIKLAIKSELVWRWQELGGEVSGCCV